VAIEIVLILVQLLILWTFLEKGSYGSSTAMESIHLLKRPLFNIGVIILGLMTPLVLLCYYWVAGNRFVVPVFASLLILMGGFFLRYCIIKGGLRLPLYSI
jgi:formate-dependent nitrite reductase membrane component NrfD